MGALSQQLALRLEAFADNKLLGAATVDGMMHGAYPIVMDGESYRKPKPLEFEA